MLQKFVICSWCTCLVWPGKLACQRGTWPRLVQYPNPGRMPGLLCPSIRFQDLSTDSTDSTRLPLPALQLIANNSNNSDPIRGKGLMCPTMSNSKRAEKSRLQPKTLPQTNSKKDRRQSTHLAVWRQRFWIERILWLSMRRASQKHELAKSVGVERLKNGSRNHHKSGFWKKHRCL